MSRERVELNPQSNNERESWGVQNVTWQVIIREKEIVME